MAASILTASTDTLLNIESTPPSAYDLDTSLASLTAHKNVLGYILLSRSASSAPSGTKEASLSIIKSSGVIFEGEQGRKYAKAVGRMADSVSEALDEVADEGEKDDIRFLRVRSKRYGILITPGTGHILALVHDPTSEA